MDVAEIRSLLDYNRWATDRLLAVAATLPPEQLSQRFGGGADSLHGTLVHLLGAEITWLQRWRGESPAGPIDVSELTTLAAIRARWSVHRDDVDRFLEGLTAETLARPVRYRNFAGVAWEYPLWRQIVHIVNHGTHHRSEIADLLTRLGQPPPPLDLLIYDDELAGSGKPPG